MKKFLRKHDELLIGLVVLAAFAYAAVDYMNLPVVHYSHLSGKCAEVKSINPMDSCNNLPSRYIRGVPYK